MPITASPTVSRPRLLIRMTITSSNLYNLCDLCVEFLAFSLHPYFIVSLLRLFTPPQSLPLAPCRSPPPASPHYSLPSLPAIPPALPSPRSPSHRLQYFLR